MFSAPPSTQAVLAGLRARKPRQGEATSFFLHPEFDLPAVKVLPGEFFVDGSNTVLTTTLGSCIAVCLVDLRTGISGMNHFMLPTAEFAGASGRTGVYAMEQLLREMARRGTQPSCLQAKVFGGGQVVKGLDSPPVGEMNVAFVRAYLREKCIPLLAEDVLGPCPRKIALFTRSGRVLCKRLPASHGADCEVLENQYKASLPTTGWPQKTEVLS